ncbi:MAG: 2-iminoacetate synthase ThiH [Desulfobacterium sp.]|jgi:2-iminoacetate synthase|nr:2-iminoacetate synthase ThiH [Desulfobacterium sp.]
MSFYNEIERHGGFDFDSFFTGVTSNQIDTILEKEQLTKNDFLALLSPAASGYLEQMAQKAQGLTRQYFGPTIQLFIPLYISNFCANECVYCGFHRGNNIQRKKLSLAEIEVEAKAIAATGMRHILILTGEAPAITPMEYLEDTVRLLRRYFASVSIEIFPMDQNDYHRLKLAGVDGLTIYQEAYDEERYALVHKAGRKTDFRYRLDAPERGAKAGFRSVNIGPLLGLGAIRSEVFFAGLHARYLNDTFLETEISLSLPRMNPAEGDYNAEFVADDRTFVQCMTALRCFLPRVGMTVSTRESSDFRDRLIRLGATKFSAGSCTGVGGYGEVQGTGTPQFEITDGRDVDEVVMAIRNAGYQPVYKDWDQF